MRLGFGLGVTALATLRTPAPLHADPDIIAALAFKQKVLSYDQGSGDRSAQLFAALPELKAYLNVGHKSQTLTAGSAHPNWNASGERIDVVAAAPNITGYDVRGTIYVAPSVAANVTISDTYVRSTPAGEFASARVQKDNSDAAYLVTIQDATLENGQATDPARFNLRRVLNLRSHADNFKIGSTGGAANPQRIELSWGQAVGFGNPNAHGDGLQASTTGDARVVATGLYSAPIVKTAEGFDKYTGPYSTESYGVTQAIRIDASGAPKQVERVHILGLMAAFGTGYPIFVSPQQTDSVVRNITIAHSIFAPRGFRFDASLDTIQIHPSLTDFAGGGGLMENVAFLGNIVFGFGPVVYADRGGPSLDVTGIWHWRKAALDAGTRALWQDLGLLDANGDPLPGMLRSVAGTVTAQGKALPTTGAVPLNLDLSGVPDDAVITLHTANVAGMYELEYDAGGTVTAQPKTVATTGAAPLNLDLTAVPASSPISVYVPDAANLYDLEFLA